MVEDTQKNSLDVLYAPKPVVAANDSAQTETVIQSGFANATIAHAKLHARMVRKTKKWTLTGAAALIVLLVIWPLTQSGKNSFKLNFASLENKTTEIPRMKGPRLHGVDKDGQPFDITADEALQEKDGKVHLKNLDSDVSTKDGDWYSLISPHADYVLKDKQLFLTGGVELFSGSGYQVQTPTAQANMDEQLVFGKEGVVTQGPMGNLKAKRFELRQNKQQIYFDGRVMVIGIPGAS